MSPVVGWMVAILVFDDAYVIAPELSDVGTVVIFTGLSPYVIELGTENVEVEKELVARMTVSTKFAVCEL